MNPVSSLVLKWYTFLTALAAVASTTLDFLSVLSGLILCWIIFIIFFIGASDYISFSAKEYSHSNKTLIINNVKLYPLWFISVISVMSSIYASHFYTGKTIFEVAAALALDVSLYNEYQRYFSQQGLSVLSIYKIPAILSMLFLKFSVVYSFVSVLVLTKKVSLSHCFWLFVISLSSLYFSIARGTSFEFFELLLLLWFCLSMRALRYETRKKFITVPKLILGCVGIAALMLYSYNISSRYSFGDVSECVTSDICLDKNSLLYFILQPIAELSFKLSGYFTFGIYYTSTLINSFMLDNHSNFFLLTFPLAIFYNTNIAPSFLCGIFLDCGGIWIPDVTLYVLKVGFLYLFGFVYLIGFFVKRLTKEAFSSNYFLPYAMLYFAFLSLVSLPVGNFLTVSSANTLILLLVSLRYLSRKILRKC